MTSRGSVEDPLAESSSTVGAQFSSSAAVAPNPSAVSEAWKRVSSEERRQKGSQFLKAYGKTWLGMSPVYLMGEAFSGKKPGSQFRSGIKELSTAAEELRAVIVTSSEDILVIIDEQLRAAGQETSKTATILQEAGQHAVVVVSTSLENSRNQWKQSSPKIRQSILKHGKDCVVLVDKALKNPVVIYGVSKYARAQGVPHPEGVLQIAALGLRKIIEAIPEDLGSSGSNIQELDASELRRMSSPQADEEADRIGKAAVA